MVGKQRKRRRARTAHTGVKLKLRFNGSWVARWVDPLSELEVQQSLTALGLSTEEARRRWAIDKAASLRRTSAAVTSGSAVAGRVPLPSAVAQYLQVSTAQPITLEGYKPSLNRLMDWASGSGIRIVQDLQPWHLTTFRDHVVKLPVSLPRAGGWRGAKAEGARTRAGVTTNKTLTVAKAFLRWARLAGFLPHIDGDAIRERLKPVKVEQDAVDFLRPQQVATLLKASLLHDGATFAKTREEHLGARPSGTTPRYEPASPFVLLAILTGMRASELIGLEWSEVDLDAGEIRLPASRVKTGMARTITLQESPSAIKVLGALRLQTAGDRVFPFWSVDLAKATRRRLVEEYEAPEFTWQALRRTCAAVLTNAGGIYGGASAYRSAKRAGHSVAIAEKHYVDLLRDLPARADTLEAALGVEPQVRQILGALGVRTSEDKSGRRAKVRTETGLA